MWQGLVSSLLSSGSGSGGAVGGGGVGYSGSNESSLYTPVDATAAGAIGPSRFDLANRYSKGVNPWALALAAVAVAFFMFRK